jgi:hypothetical protein
MADTNNLVLRGFSFRLGDDDHRSEVLLASAPVHFARTLDQILAFLRARIPGPDGSPDVEKVREGATNVAIPAFVRRARRRAWALSPHSNQFEGIREGKS